MDASKTLREEATVDLFDEQDETEQSDTVVVFQDEIVSDAFLPIDEMTLEETNEVFAAGTADAVAIAIEESEEIMLENESSTTKDEETDGSRVSTPHSTAEEAYGLVPVATDENLEAGETTAQEGDTSTSPYMAPSDTITPTDLTALKIAGEEGVADTITSPSLVPSDLIASDLATSDLAAFETATEEGGSEQPKASKYFASPAEAGSNAEGKQFFDSFTAGESGGSRETGQAEDLSPTVKPPMEPLSPLHITRGATTALPVNTALQQQGQLSPTRNLMPFIGGGSLELENDPFAIALSTSEQDRRHDAWIPSDHTCKQLAAKLAGVELSEPAGSGLTTAPAVLVEESQGDPVRDLVYRFMGEQESIRRKALTANQVTQDEKGLRQLLSSKCYRAAVDLTATLLAQCGQGKDRTSYPITHTPASLQTWHIRIALLMRLRQFSTAEAEMQAFGNLDNCDLYFEFYPDVYPGRKGSMVPFEFRLLHAELPQYNGRPQESLDRIYYLHSVCSQILKNLREGLAENGGTIEMTDENRQASISLWEKREIRVEYAIANCLVALKDYFQAHYVLEQLTKKDSANTHIILSSVGRLYLQLGDMKMAEQCFMEADKRVEGDSQANKMQSLLNRAHLNIAQNSYGEAYQKFKEVIQLDPNNAVAVNNSAVCLLYMGELKEAVGVLENLVHSNPAQNIHESVIFNLCTIYELESARSMHKKQALLNLVNRHQGDGFNVQCLKMM